METYNCIIHKSHTKAYIMKVIQLLDIPIKYNMFNKNELLEELDDWILTNMDLVFDGDNLLEMGSVIELMSFLEQPAVETYNYSTIKHKQLLLLKAKQLICYINNGKDLNRSFYKNPCDIRDDAILLAEHGKTLPQCRRAIFLYNNSVSIKDKICVDNNKYSMEEMKIQLKQKKMQQPIYQKKVGKYNITFD
tara:strand:- start:601 stop:1176 length:576 start_codon:yes stop_codon:yes gene_type:complete